MRLCALLAFSSAVLAQPRPLIGLGGIVHETNTFNPKKTTVADFEEGLGVNGILRGEAIFSELDNANSTATGFIQEIGRAHV